MSKLPLSIILVIVLAGCTYPAGSGYEIGFDGDVQKTDQGVRMVGEIDVDQGSEPERNFTNVKISFYDSNKEKLHEVSIGKITTEPDEYVNRRNVNLSLDFTPTYIIIESPDFWNSNSFLNFNEAAVAVIAFKKTEEGYQQYYVSSSGEKFQTAT